MSIDQQLHLINCNPVTKVFNGYDIFYSNINYNYNVGFNIKLNLLSKIFTQDTGFICEYQIDLNKFASVSYFMNIPKELRNSIRKKTDSFSHKFTVYKTGSVTQSGPHPELNKIAFNKFKEVILKNKNVITKKDN